MDGSLTDPLLLVDNDNAVTMSDLSTSSSEWPTKTAECTKLFIPPANNLGSGRECTLRYNSEGRTIMVCADQGGIVDMFYAYDVIGADVEIKLLGSESEQPRTFYNKSPVGAAGSDQKVPGTPIENKSASDIFKPLTEDEDKIFSTSNNEPLTDIPFDTQATAFLTIYVYPRKDPNQSSSFQSCFGSNKPKPNIRLPPAHEANSENTLLGRFPYHRRFQVAPAEDFSGISKLVRGIRRISRPEDPASVVPSPTTQRQRMFVVINPMSGPKRNGETLFRDKLAPMFEQAGIEFDVFVTEYPNHAAERMAITGTSSSTTTRERNGGTSTGEEEVDNRSTDPDVSEYTAIVTVGGDGIMHEVLQGIKDRPDAERILKNLKIGMIGTGTSNGMAKSLAHASKEMCSPIDSAFSIVKGKTKAIDISRYETENNNYLSFLTYSWSIMAAIDLESEALHFLGSLRFDLWGLLQVILLKQYRARFSYLPVSSASSRKSDTPLVEKLPSLSEAVPSEWTTVEDNLTLFWATHVSHAAENTFHAPPVRVGDGFFTIVVVRGNVSRLRMAMVLLGLENGSHAEMDGVEFIQCLAYRLEPISKGINDLDGEAIESGPIQGCVMPSAVQIYCNVAGDTP